MMKRLFILFTIFLSYASTTLQAQDNLPQNFSISLGGGVTLPRVEGNRNDFFSKNGDRAGYNLMTEGRYYFMPNFALGLQYDYLRVARLPDKMHLHYIHPNIINPEKPDVPLNKNDAFQKVQKRRVQEKR